MRKLLLIFVALTISACGSTGSQRAIKVVVEVGANCEHLEGEEWRDCMMDESRRIAGKAIIEEIAKEIE